jgi:hypothetical protein
MQGLLMLAVFAAISATARQTLLRAPALVKQRLLSLQPKLWISMDEHDLVSSHSMP